MASGRDGSQARGDRALAIVVNETPHVLGRTFVAARGGRAPSLNWTRIALAPFARLVRHIVQEKQSNPGHHACEQHDSENEENISQGVVG